MEKDINDLPVDIWILIFRSLSIKDLFNCRLVNKKFKNFSDFTDGISKLIVGESNSSYDYNYWYYNYKQIEDKDKISLKCFRFIKKLSLFNLDKYLKYLKIYDHQLKLEELLNLINLKSIEFGFNYNDVNQSILNLNNLKVFVGNNFFVQLDTPKLEKIRFQNINQIKLNSNPDLIKHLITCNYDTKLEEFKNLEIMELRDIDQPTINRNLLSLFKNLKQLKINLEFDELNYSNEIIKNSLIKILNHNIKLRKEIDIYLEGIKIENIDKFNELVSIGDSIWKFRLNNYDLIDLNLPFINYLYYEELEEYYNKKNGRNFLSTYLSTFFCKEQVLKTKEDSNQKLCLKNDLPHSFFDKFIYINYVDVEKVNDIDSLNWFLNKLKYLNRLEIGYRVSLDEVFYNNLPNTIRFLIIYDDEEIDYDFILKLPKLVELETQVDKDLFDLAFESFLGLKYLNKFKFYYNDKVILIKKKGKFFYLNGKKVYFNQLVKLCNEMR